MKRQHNPKNGKPVTLAQLKQVIAPLYKRFDGVDQRFDGVDQRFDGVDQRFEQIDQRFEKIDQRFEQIDQRFEKIDQRFEQIDQRFEKIDQRFEKIDEQFKAIDNQFISLNGKISAFVGITNMNIRDAEERLEQKFMKKFEEKFAPIMDAVDVFMKLSRDSDREIVLLGKQHDDLAKYCTAKIGYPTYGRNL